LRFDGSDFVKAQADNEADAEIVGMVSFLNGTNSFYLTQVGFVSDITTQVLVAGTLYYLDPMTAGLLTPTKPVTVGLVELPCFIAFTDSSGFFFTNVGTLVQSGSLFAWETITANQTLEVNKGYYVNGVGALNDLKLPPTCSSGDTVEIWDIGGNGFSVTQSAGQSIIAGTTTSTVGAVGNVASSALGNKLIINCYTANTGFIANIAQTAGGSIVVT
jgi:hypothetical protein